MAKEENTMASCEDIVVERNETRRRLPTSDH